MTNTATIPAVIVALGLVILATVILIKPITQVLGSTVQGSEYQATTTSTGRFQAETQLLSGVGTLGSVVITGAATGVINLYDATTSNATQRASSMPTSSILVASFPASTATGTYVFDRVLFNGLYISVVGTMPTSTITFR